MKIRTLLTAALALSVVLASFASPASAEQPWARRLHVGAHVGWLGLDDPSGLGNAYFIDDMPQSGVLLGLRLSYPVLRTLWVDAEFNYTPSEMPRAPKESASVLGYRVLVRYTAMPKAALRPFVTAGLGQYRLGVSKQYVLDGDTDSTYILGAGAQYQLGYRLFLRLDGRWVGSEARPDEPEKDADGAVVKDGKTLTYGISNNFEVTLGVSYAFGGPAKDSDGDGIPDDKDKCPNQAEDKDGFQDGDGCPEIDNDQDGVVDSADRCPNKREDKDGFQDGDGCPDPDNDRDGIPDGKDKCPNKAEDKDGFQDGDGCPDTDNDRDGVPDSKDKCPNKREDKDGFQDGDGCPDLDNDGDGIPDAKDKCPNKPETKNGFQDDDGCPDNMPPHIAPLFQGPVKGLKFRRAKLVKGSTKPLEKLLELLLEVESIRIEIHVHTHTRGKPAKLKKLADKRAKAIIAFFEDAGIDSKRFVIVAHGPDEPVDKGRGRKAKKANERVLFKIAGPVARPGR